MTLESYDVLILFGTQTGQSKAIAETIAERGEAEHGIKTKVCCLSLFDKEFFLEKEQLVVVIISSTGDGDPPESTIKFFRKLNRKTLPEDTLSKLQFALLGLGDTNYNNFCACPKRLEKRLLSLGAKKFYSSGFCDDAVGTELVAEPWIEGLFVVLKQILSGQFVSSSMENVENLIKGLRIETKPAEDDDTYSKFTCSLTWNNSNCECLWPEQSLKFSSQLNELSELKVPLLSPAYLSAKFSDETYNWNDDRFQTWAEFPSKIGPIYSAVLVSRSQLTKIGSKKTKYSIWIEIPGNDDLNCCPGDAFYFICPNHSEEVHWLLQRLNVNLYADKKCTVNVLPDTTKKNASVPSYVPSVLSLRYLFSFCLDFRRPISRTLLRILVEHCKNDAEKRRLTELSSNQGMNEFNEYVRVNGLSLLDVLHAFPSCYPPVERLLEHLPRFQPRPLSIASSTLNSRRQFRFVYSLVDIPVGGGRFYKRQGMCTGYLSNAAIHSRIRVFRKKPSQFRLPLELNFPLIMVCPGTGVAPFVGFLENLKNESESSSKAERWLFFGCRDKDRDYILREELESFENDHLIKLIVCFSQFPRSEENIRYVQHNIVKFGESLLKLLLNDERTKIFVCGDAKNMANDVFNSFVDILITEGGKSKEEALQFLKLMQDHHRYVQDVWT